MPSDRILSYRTISELHPDPRNPRIHSRAQINAIARSIDSFGFNAPVLVDRNSKVVAGHGRLEAAKLLGLERVPVIALDDLSEAQAKAYLLADNKLNERSDWSAPLLAQHLNELSEISLDFEIEDTGFETPEIDLLIQGIGAPDDEDQADTFRLASGPPISKLGDLWTLGEHRIYCGDALAPSSYDTLFGAEIASAVFTGPPYNVKIGGNVSGLGKVQHREFAMASGEMTENQFTNFLTQIFGHCKARTNPGALIYACMDWRHLPEMQLARSANTLDLLNLCVWVKSNGGMGAFYRSRHELIFVFRNGSAPHLNNVQLGRFGRNRTNVWHYAGANSFPRSGQKDDWHLHPTVKPVRLVADIILDSTSSAQIVLDPFLGSGTTLVAAERTRRRAYAMELDPQYVDTAIMRWKTMTGLDAIDAFGTRFSDRQQKAAAP